MINLVSRVRRWVETDTGHRIPNHKSKCKHMHGHRYRWEAVVEGDVVTEEGVTETGMVIDFSSLSKILMDRIHDIVDHAFIVFEEDHQAREALDLLGENHRTLVVPFVPTAENLAKWAFDQIQPHIVTEYGNELRLVEFHVRETPKSWASWSA